MALGFGFNKAKVLASAEKYVQQGKLQNAIGEYEKVLKEDPKDLTVLNTVGDLCARIGQNDQAATYFKKVGDAYAADGFTVKAIAMYKKLTKLSPGQTEAILKLAELYTVQGLYNDARAQYVQVADQYLKAGDNDAAARTLQKILELDPENTAMQSKLADLYMKLNKRDQAKGIYFTAAQSLYAKQAMDSADEALSRVLSIDANNVDALLLRGTIAAESGNGAAAAEYLKKIPNLDSRPDALKSLLRAEILLGNFDDAEPVAVKLISVHNDVNGVIIYGDALLNAGRYEEGIKFYDKFADKVLPKNAGPLVRALDSVISKVKESSTALEGLRDLFQKAGETSKDNELMELLAHACVHEGKLAKARDLYKILSELETENPLHAQNYKQVVAKMGDDATAKAFGGDQASQAIMMDELDHEHKNPVIASDYPPDVAAAIRTAITDSELFDSYNLPAKAIPPLEAALAKAPQDSQLNTRLAGLYAKVRRFPEAAKCAEVVRDVYAQHGHADDSHKYAELAKQYLAEASAPPPAAAAPATIEEPGFTAADFGFADDGSAAPPPTPGFGAEFVASSASHVEVPASSPTSGAEFGFTEPAPSAFEGAAIPFDPTAPAEAPAAPPIAEFGFSPSEPAAAAAETPAFEIPAVPVEAPMEAAPAPRAVEAAHEEAHAEWESMLHVEEAPAAPVAEAAAPAIAEADTNSLAGELAFYISQSMWTEAESALGKLQAVAPNDSRIAEFAAQIDSGKSAPVAQEGGSVAEFSFESASAPAEPAVEPPPPAAQPAPAPIPVAPAAAPVAQPAMAASAAATPSVAAPASGGEDLLGDLVSDLEASIGDFAPPAPQAKAAAAPAPSAPTAVAAPKPAAMQAAAPQTAAPASQEPIIPADHKEAASVLSDLFDEFKEDVEESAGEAEDPGTHYSLGVAFREMGLLDEAIGELQKVCHAIDRGHEFGEKMQAYTWLALCLVEKGVPEAAVRWYEKALKVPDITEDSRLAVYYDMANAYELAGNTKSAYAKFMEVYSSNIDYRDVADRLKALKQ